MGHRTGRKKGRPTKATDRQVLAMKAWLIRQAALAGRTYYTGRGRPPEGQIPLNTELAKRLKMSRTQVYRALNGLPRDGSKPLTLAELRAAEELAARSVSEIGTKGAYSPGVHSNTLDDKHIVNPSPANNQIGGTAFTHHFPRPAQPPGQQEIHSAPPVSPLPHTTPTAVPASSSIGDHPTPIADVVTNPSVGIRGLDAIGLTLAPATAQQRPIPPNPAPSAATGAASIRPSDQWVVEALEESLGAFVSSVQTDATTMTLAKQLLGRITAPSPTSKP